MRIAANIRDKKLRDEQFDVMINVLGVIQSKDDLGLFMKSLLSDSERNYLGQRLNIMRMLAKHFNYFKIQEKLNVSTATITNAQKCLDNGGKILSDIILQYKYVSNVKEVNKTGNSNKNPFKAHYPGSMLK